MAKSSRPSSKSGLSRLANRRRKRDDCDDAQHKPQAPKAKLTDRLKSLLSDPLFADLTFLVGEWDEAVKGPVQRQWLRRFRAHKAIVHGASEVFRAMLSGPLAEQREVLVNDIQPDAFHVMLRYIYSDELQLQDDCLVGTLKAADKYALPELVEATVDRLIRRTNLENVLQLHEQTCIFEHVRLAEHIAGFVRDETKALVESNSFTSASRSSLELILRQPQLQVVETRLFEACLRWAHAECARKRVQPAKAAQLREALGELVYLLRVPTLSAADFQRVAAGSGIFTDEEQLDIYAYLCSSGVCCGRFAGRFELQPRGVVGARCVDICSVGAAAEDVGLTAEMFELRESIRFECDRDFHLVGFRYWTECGFRRYSNLTLTAGGQVLYFESDVQFAELKTLGDGPNGLHHIAENLHRVDFRAPVRIRGGLEHQLSMSVHRSCEDQRHSAPPMLTDVYGAKTEHAAGDVRITVWVQGFGSVSNFMDLYTC